jgi:hypothetical protein
MQVIFFHYKVKKYEAQPNLRRSRRDNCSQAIGIDILLPSKISMARSYSHARGYKIFDGLAPKGKPSKPKHENRTPRGGLRLQFAPANCGLFVCQRHAFLKERLTPRFTVSRPD